VNRFTGALESLRAHGTAATLKRYIDGDLE